VNTVFVKLAAKVTHNLAYTAENIIFKKQGKMIYFEFTSVKEELRSCNHRNEHKDRTQRMEISLTEN